MGIEPTCAAWEAAILPLNYARNGPVCSGSKTEVKPVQQLSLPLCLSLGAVCKILIGDAGPVRGGAPGVGRSTRLPMHETASPSSPAIAKKYLSMATPTTWHGNPSCLRCTSCNTSMRVPDRPTPGVPPLPPACPRTAVRRATYAMDCANRP